MIAHLFFSLLCWVMLLVWTVLLPPISFAICAPFFARLGVMPNPDIYVFFAIVFVFFGGGCLLQYLSSGYFHFPFVRSRERDFWEVDL